MKDDQTNQNWQRISALQKMGLKELREEYAKIFGKESKSRSRKYLYAAIAKKLQAASGQAESKGSSDSALTSKFNPKRKRLVRNSTKAKGSAKQPRKRQSRPLGATDPRLPKVGTTITKTYKGKKINVRVLENGFEYAGQQFRSLSALARHITGSIWNGFLFFGLTKRGSK
ncbi:MAG: DUF2924 domain-containing protein [bacterium]